MTRRSVIKISVIAVLGLVFAGLYFTPARDYMTGERLGEMVKLLRSLWYAPVLFIAAYAIGCIFAVPATIFVLAAGLVFGWKLGGLYGITGGVLGAAMSYYIGRFLGEGLLQKFGRAGHMVEQRVSRAGLRTMIIIRLIPGPPFAVWNYGAGVARVNFRDFILGTFIGALPGHLIFAYFADAIFSGTMSRDDALKRAFIAAGLMLFLVLLPTIVKRVAGVKAGDEGIEG